MTRWTPDTCGCELEYDGDINHVASHRLCPKHAHLTGGAHLAEVLAHNRKKNHVLNAAHQHVSDAGGDPSSMRVEYDEQDDLHVHGLDPAHHEAVRGKVAHLLGKSGLRIH